MTKSSFARCSLWLMLFCTTWWGCADESDDLAASVHILSVQPQRSYPGVNTTVEFEIVPGSKTARGDLSWQVHFGDGQRVAGDLLNTSASHVYQASGQYTLEVVALAGSRELGRDAVSVKVLGSVDLALSQTRAAPANVRAGEALSVSFSATNLEPGPVEAPFEVSAYLSPDPQVRPNQLDALPLLGRTTVSSADPDQPVIAAGEQAALGFSTSVPDGVPAGDYYVVTFADPAGQFSDVDPSNNLDVSTHIIRVGDAVQLVPDLAVRDVVLMPDRAFPTLNQVSRSFTITNLGELDALNVVARAWLSIGNATLDPAQDILLEETEPFRVAPGAQRVFDPKSIVLTDEIAPPTGGSLQVYLVVEVAIEGDSPETNLDNNVAASLTPTLVTDERVEGTDIAVSDFSVTPDATYLDGTLHVGMTIRNEGTLAAGSFFCGLYLADEPRVNTDRDPRLSNINLSGLAGGAEQVIERDITIPAIFNPGTYYIYVVCDPVGALSEPYRSNNQAIFPTPIRITDQADIDLYVEKLTVPAAAASGDTVTLTATLCVSGSNASGNTRGKLWRTTSSAPDFSRPALLSFNIPNINPGDCIELPIETVADCENFKSEYRYGIEVDTDAQLPETDETNNRAAGDRAMQVSGEYCACTPDGRGNDNVLSAHSLTPGAHAEQLCLPERCDFYRVGLQAGESLMVTTTFDAARGQLETTLFGPGGVNQLERSALPGRQEVATFFSPAADDYIFSVCGTTADAQNLYDLDVAVIPLADDFDVIPRALTLPARDSFSIGARLDIAFKVYNLGALATPGDFEAKLVLSPDPIIGDANDVALSPQSITVASIAPSSSREVSAQVTIPTTVPDGDYYLGVLLDLDDADPTNNQVASRKITIKTRCYDPLEPNDSFGEAAPISAGSYSNLVACAAADDYYKLCVADGKKFSVRVDFDGAQGDIDMDLYQQERQRIGGSSNVGTDHEQVGVDYVNGDQCYYVNVHLVTIDPQLQINYSMSVAVQDVAPDLRCAGAFEPNDTLQNPASLRAALASSLTLDRCPADDTDFYYVSLTAGQRISLRGIIDPPNQAGTLRLQLYHPNGTVGPNRESAPGIPTAEIADFVAPTSGVYHLQVTISGTQRRVIYRLEADGLGTISGVDLLARDLIIGPGSYAPEDQVRLGFTIENRGGAAASEPSYEVFLGRLATHDAAQDVALGAFSLTSAIAAGAERAVTARVNLPADGLWTGAVYLHVVVASNAQPDVDPTNNTATTSILLSDD